MKFKTLVIGLATSFMIAAPSMASEPKINVDEFGDVTSTTLILSHYME